MAGSFVKYNNIYQGKYKYHSEWNVVQDIKAAQTIAKYFSKPIFYCPHEIGLNVLIGSVLVGTQLPCVRQQILLYAIVNKTDFINIYMKNKL